MKERNYEHLEGKIINWTDRHGTTVKGEVAYVEYDIGLTIVLAEDVVVGDYTFVKGREMTCINGPHSPHSTSYNYEESFYSAVASIERGEFDARVDDEITGASETACGGVRCAFKGR